MLKSADRQPLMFIGPADNTTILRIGHRLLPSSAWCERIGIRTATDKFALI
jgi:hypothetical protein